MRQYVTSSTDSGRQGRDVKTPPGSEWSNLGEEVRHSITRLRVGEQGMKLNVTSSLTRIRGRQTSQASPVSERENTGRG